MLDETGEEAAAVGDDPFAQGTWMALAYTIFIGGIVGFGLWFWLIARCTMACVAPFALLQDAEMAFELRTGCRKRRHRLKRYNTNGPND
jgi:hypothetical protein